MRAAHIVPPALLDRYGTASEYHLILAHLVLQNDYYREFYRERSEAGDFIILDNGAFEFQTSISAQELFAAARFVQPSVIVLPDVLRDAEATYEATKDALRFWNGLRPELHFQNEPSFMVVPQGKDLEEWFACWKKLRFVGPYINIIGLFEELADWHDRGRVGVIEEAHRRHMCRQESTGSKQFHLLGFQENILEELIAARVWSCIIGTDSGKAFPMGTMTSSSGT